MRPQFHLSSIWITAVQTAAILIIDPVLVHLPHLRRRNHALPEISIVDLMHGFTVPLVELTNHCNPPGCRSKHPEHHSIVCHMRPQIFMGMKFSSCIKSIKIHPFSSLSGHGFSPSLILRLYHFFLYPTSSQV